MRVFKQSQNRIYLLAEHLNRMGRPLKPNKNSTLFHRISVYTKISCINALAIALKQTNGVLPTMNVLF